MSDDYVSRKAVRDRVLSLSLKRFELSDAYKVYVEAIKNAGVEIARTPAADVEPVRHGQWEQKTVFETKGNVDELQSAFCPVCEKYLTTPHAYYFTHYNYCPNCGARMDG